MTAPRVLPIVLVTWVDAHAPAPGWRKRTKQVSADPGLAYTAGFLMRCDKDAVVVACSYDPTGDHVNSGMTIPRGWVRSVKRLGTWKVPS